MKKTALYLTGIVLLGILAACSDKDDNNTPAAQKVEEVVYNVDVILPKAIQEQWKTT